MAYETFEHDEPNDYTNEPPEEANGGAAAEYALQQPDIAAEQRALADEDADTVPLGSALVPPPKAVSREEERPGDKLDERRPASETSEAEPPAPLAGEGGSGSGQLPPGGSSPAEMPEGDDEAERKPALSDTEEHTAPAQLDVREYKSDTQVGGLRRLDTLNATVRQLGDAVAEEAVVVGSSALREALGDAVRDPNDVDISVTEGAYRHLRMQPGWTERLSSDGKHLITNGEVEVGTEGWGEVSHQQLQEGAWKTPGPDGVPVAGLQYVTAYKDWRGTEKDLQDLQDVRDRLLDPDQPPLPSHITARDAEIVRDCLPEHLRDDPDLQSGVELAANGLLIVKTCYGDPEIGVPLPIVGELEKPGDGARAFYHNGFDVETDMRALQQHYDNVNAAAVAEGRRPVFTDQDRVDGLAAEAYSDAVYGFGRKANNPEGHDELRSAALLASHARVVGYDEQRAEDLRAVVYGTTFDEKTGSQAGTYHPDPRVRALCGVDLYGLATPGALVAANDLLFENMTSNRDPKSDRILAKVAEEKGEVLRTSEESAAFVDAYPDARPADNPTGPTLKEAALRNMAANAGFIERHRYPAGWTLDNLEQRGENGALQRELARDVALGNITMAQFRKRTEDYAQEEE